MKRICSFVLIIFVMSMAPRLSAQTDSLNINWQPNSESNMKEYRLYRGVNSTTNLQLLQTITHPGVHAVDRYNISPGNLYAYSLIAVDADGNSSAFAPVVSVGVPGITWTETEFNSGEVLAVPLTNICEDPDNDVSELNISATNQNHVRVTVTATEIQVEADPANYSGNASFTLTAEDPTGLWDRKNVQLNIAQVVAPVFTVKVPPLNFKEDESVTVSLDTCVEINTYSPSQLSWQFLGLDNLKANYQASSRKVTFTSQTANWNGQDEITFQAIAPDQSTSQQKDVVTVSPVNDAPTVTLTDLYTNSSSQNTYDLKVYSSDVDNTDEELTWSFSGYSHFQIEWVDQAKKIIKITNLDGTLTENGTFTAKDPAGASTSAQVILHFSSSTANRPPHFKGVPKKVKFAEDGKLEIELGKLVVDSTNSFGELTWDITTGSHLSYKTDPDNGVLSLSSDKDWNGNSSVALKVTDPEGLSDEVTVGVMVLPRVDIRNFRITPIDRNNVQVEINGDEPSKVTFTYWVSPILMHSYTSKDYETHHQFKLSGLQPDTSYTFNFSLEDTSGYMVDLSNSSFSTSGSVASDESNDNEKIIVYPNPYRPANGHSGIIFENLSTEVTGISVYNLTGDLVFKKNMEGLPPREWIWDGMSLSGQPLSSGLYIYVVNGEGNAKLQSGKIAVIR